MTGVFRRRDQTIDALGPEELAHTASLTASVDPVPRGESSSSSIRALLRKRAWPSEPPSCAPSASVSFVPSDPQRVSCSSVSFQSCVFFDQLLEPVPGEADRQPGVVALALPPDDRAPAVLRVLDRRPRFPWRLRFRRRRRNLWPLRN